MSNYPTHAELRDLIISHGRGSEARLNHGVVDPTCGGESRSMKVRATSDGGISWVCFRCGQHGYARPSGVARRTQDNLYTDEIPEGDPEWKTEFPEVERNPLRWSFLARKWFFEYLDMEAVRLHHVGEWDGRLWLPVTRDQQIVKWTGRRLYAEDRMKYLTGKAKGYERHDIFWPEHGVNRKLVVLTEDWVSAAAVASKLNLPAFPLMGVALSAPQAKHLYRERLPRAVVWLDNDGAQVDKAGRKTAKDLRGYGMKVDIFRELGDPKTELARMSHAQLTELGESLCTL